jgi:fatty acid desaturase
VAADLGRPSPAAYWTDLGLSVLVLAAALAAAVLAPGAWRLAGGIVAALALYRAISFIHELTHLRPDELPGFKFAWNALVGVPFLAPSLLYEGVHNIHHVQQRYGTSEDPEYLPLAGGSWRGLAGFVAVGLLAPLGAFLRFAVGTPLSLLVPSLRTVVFERYSAMVINPGFRRRDLASAATPAWRAQEIACWLWSWTLVAIVVQGGLGARAVLTGATVMSAATFVNQLRTLVAHAWAGDGKPMSLADQYRDTVNVPPPGVLPFLWAPVGLRYHALHHLVPRVPYHNLGEAHRRLVAALPPGSGYYAAQRRGLVDAVASLVRRTQGGGDTY